MKLKLFASLILSCTISLIYLTLTSSSSGVVNQAGTGCGGSSCHGNMGTGTTITLTGIPTSGYIAGTVYTLTLTISNSSMSAAGFNLQCDNGTIVAGTGTTTFNQTDQLTHSSKKSLSGGSTSWTFNWTAPSSLITTFTISGNAVNSNNAGTGDSWTKVVLNLSKNTYIPPVISNITLTGINSTTAALSASVNPNGNNTTCGVKFGKTTTYGNAVLTSPTAITTTQTVLANLTGLQPNTLYHYKVFAVTAFDSTFSADLTFTTKPTSIHTIEELGIQVYPNPVTDMLILESTQNEINPSNIELYNNLGQLVNIKIQENFNSKMFLDIKNLPCGTYYLTITKNNSRASYPFLKK